MSSSESPAVPFFKKKTKAGASTATKKRALSPAGEDNSSNSNKRSANRDDERGEGPSVVRLAKKDVYNPLRQGTSAFKRRKQDGEAGDDDQDDFDDGASVSVRYNDRGTAARRQRSASPTNMVLSGDAALAKSGEAPTDDGLYHGKASYTTGIAKPAPGETFGPIKGPNANIKTITLVDYQPDVCKDYKETGWCGFGDSCKFLHDRGDYLRGWELDNSYLSNQPKADASTMQEVVEEELPFACLICREPFAAPPHDAVVTRCNHYFGSSCAIKRFRKTPKCFACGASTGGIFNKATRILERKEKAQKERIKQREKAEAGEGGYLDEDEGDGLEIEGLQEG